MKKKKNEQSIKKKVDTNENNYKKKYKKVSREPRNLQ